MRPQQMYSRCPSSPFSEPVPCCICANKSRHTGGCYPVLITECVSILWKDVCPHKPVNRPVNTVCKCRCSSFCFTLAWVFLNPPPHPDVPHANKIPFSMAGGIVPSDHCYSGAGKFPLRSNAEFGCRCFSPIKISSSVLSVWGEGSVKK